MMVNALRRSPEAVVCVLTLALSVAAATIVFSIVNGVLLKPLPYPQSEALVSLWNSQKSSESPRLVPLSATQFFTYRDESHAFAAFGLWSMGIASVTGAAEPEEVRTLRVTHGILDALNVLPSAGRWFSRRDDAPGAADTVILTDTYWKRRHLTDMSMNGAVRERQSRFPRGSG